MILLIFIFLLDPVYGSGCVGSEYNATLAAYYPDAFGDDDLGYYDVIKSEHLGTLQDFLDGRSNYVTVAMDEKLQLPYGTKVCIPSINKHFGKEINFEARDTNEYLFNQGFTRLDICVRSEQDSYDTIVNDITKIVIPNK